MRVRVRVRVREAPIAVVVVAPRVGRGHVMDGGALAIAARRGGA